MENNLLQFLPVKEVTGSKVIRNQIIFMLILASIGWFLLALHHYDVGSLIITGLVLVPLIILIPLTTKVTTQITVDLNSKTFTANYFNALGQSKTLTLNLYNSFISYEYATSRTGGYWQLRIYENMINKWFKVRESKNGYSKEQLDEIYAALQPYQQNIITKTTPIRYFYSAIFAALVVVGSWLWVFFSFNTLFYLGIVAVVYGIGGLGFMWIDIRLGKKGSHFLNTSLVFATVAFVAIFLNIAKKSYIKNQMKEHGITRFVTIADTYNKYSSRGSRVYFAVFSYTVNNHIYFKKIDNEKGVYKVGDSLKILFSSINPEIYMIVGNKTGTHEPVEALPKRN